jgi:hypothetical protein
VARDHGLAGWVVVRDQPSLALNVAKTPFGMSRYSGGMAAATTSAAVCPFTQHLTVPRQ